MDGQFAGIPVLVNTCVLQYLYSAIMELTQQHAGCKHWLSFQSTIEASGGKVAVLYYGSYEEGLDWLEKTKFSYDLLQDSDQMVII